MYELSEVVLEQAALGDMDAFEQMMRHYEKLIYSITTRMFPNKEDAEDMLQEVFMKAYKNIGSCKSLKHYKTWLCTIATNTCIDELRRRKNKDAKSLDEDAAAGGQAELYVVSSQPTPEDAAIGSETWRELQRAMDKLSENEKILIVLRDIEGFSYQETAEITGLNLGTLKSRLSRARLKLRKLFLLEQNRNKHVIS